MFVQYFESPGSGKVHREETTHFDVPRHGSHFEADEVAHWVLDGKLGSSVLGRDKTLLEMEIFDEGNAHACYNSSYSHCHQQGRRQGGYRLPEEAIYVRGKQFEVEHLCPKKLDMTRSFTISPVHTYLRRQVAKSDAYSTDDN